MKLQTINKTNEAIKNILNSVEREKCVLPSDEKSEYDEYFDEIEKAICAVHDRFFKDYVYNKEVKKNE